MSMFPQTILDLFGDRGRTWLEDLPDLIRDLEQCWELTAQPPFENLSYNYVAPALQKDGTPVVLKIGVPGGTIDNEWAALEHYAGRGMVRLLAADPGAGSLLLERLNPGTPLALMKDDGEATRIAAVVMRETWHPLQGPHPFPTTNTIAEGLARLRTVFHGGSGPFPEPFVSRAEGLFADLLASQGPPVLLHGDLHHWNILQAEGGWRAIDPQGFVGEPEYEIGAMMRNPIPYVFTWHDLAKRQERRLAIFSEVLGFDRQRMAGWSFAQEVLSAWWAYEDHGLVGAEWLSIAASLEALL